MTNSVRIVETSNPKMSDTARPEKMGSSRMKAAPVDTLPDPISHPGFTEQGAPGIAKRGRHAKRLELELPPLSSISRSHALTRCYQQRQFRPMSFYLNARHRKVQDGAKARSGAAPEQGS